MITIDYIGGGRVRKNPKNDYVILEQPLKINIKYLQLKFDPKKISMVGCLGSDSKSSLIFWILLLKIIML